MQAILQSLREAARDAIAAANALASISERLLNEYEAKAADIANVEREKDELAKIRQEVGSRKEELALLRASVDETRETLGRIKASIPA